MGVYYHYVNHTKEQRFALSILGGGDRFAAIGHTLAARAFELMLIRPLETVSAHRKAICGQWHGDTVSVEGDEDNEDWSQFLLFANIGADVIVWMHEVDGFDPLAEAAAESDLFLAQLTYLVRTEQAPALAEPLAAAFPDYLQRYEAFRQEKSWHDFLDLTPALHV